ncbi:MAG TPA: CAP domain-containing protein, partial [Chloroflexota bacterium]|nr:CAP domain-containing protein [Chloroflexota bacterium]
NGVRGRGYDCGERGSFGPAVPLAWNPTLAEAAEDHGRDMAAHGFFSHTGSDGTDVSDRVERHGYAWSAVGENLADATPGHFTPKSVVEAWLGSPGHCANLLRPEFREIGAAKVTEDLEYWTQVFGTPR